MDRGFLCRVKYLKNMECPPVMTWKKKQLPHEAVKSGPQSHLVLVVNTKTIIYVLDSFIVDLLLTLFWIVQVCGIL